MYCLRVRSTGAPVLAKSTCECRDARMCESWTALVARSCALACREVRCCFGLLFIYVLMGFLHVVHIVLTLKLRILSSRLSRLVVLRRLQTWEFESREVSPNPFLLLLDWCCSDLNLTSFLTWHCQNLTFFCYELPLIITRKNSEKPIYCQTLGPVGARNSMFPAFKFQVKTPL